MNQLNNTNNIQKKDIIDFENNKKFNSLFFIFYVLNNKNAACIH